MSYVTFTVKTSTPRCNKQQRNRFPLLIYPHTAQSKGNRDCLGYKVMCVLMFYAKLLLIDKACRCH